MRVRGQRAGSPLSMLLSAAFFLLGALLGGILSVNSAETMGDELRRYWESYLVLRTTCGPSAAAVWQTFGCFFRSSVVVFLLGFASLGVILIPCVCAAQGFLYAFVFACFSAGLGQEWFLLLPVLFAVRLLVVLPCTLLLSSAAWESARALAALSLGSGKRVKGMTYGKSYWLRFGKACACLCLGAGLELWLIPRLLVFLI